MSYSFGVSCVGEDLREQAEKTAAASLNMNRPAEVDDDIAAAIDAAERLALALSDGAGGVPLNVSISGHANAGRQAPQGWSPDSVYVSVSRVRVEAPAGTGG